MKGVTVRTYDCDDLTLTFTRGDDGAFSVRAVDTRGRSAASTFRIPLTRDQLEDRVVELGRSVTREIQPAGSETVQASAEELGRQLGDALFDTTLGPFYEQARRDAAADNRGLRLTLSLADVPELLSVPWELLYRRPSFLASQRRSPVVRYLEVGELPGAQRIEGAVRVLGVVASPTGVPALDVADERRRVEDALADMIGRGLVELVWCDPATPRLLRQALRDGTFHVLHFVGHSDFTPAGEGLVYLTDDDGAPAPVTETVLTNLLGDQTSLRLAVINSCKGARTTLTDPYAGIATSLVALGIPAVIAMQFSISDRAAIVFAEELFTSLIGRQYPVDAAVAEARKAVLTEVSELEWATPVLFMRSEDGQLFDFATSPTAIPLRVEPTAIVADDPSRAAAATPAPAPEPTAPEPTAPAGAPPAVTPNEPRRRRPLTALVASAAAGAALVGGITWAATRPDGGGAALPTQPTTAAPVLDPMTTTQPVAVTTPDSATATSTTAATATTAATNPPSTTAAGATPFPTVPFYENTTTCAGEPVPPRLAPVGLSDAERQGFDRIQQWMDLLGRARPGDDTANQRLADEMAGLFPNWGKDVAGYVNMAVTHLLPAAIDPLGDGSTAYIVGEVVYDDASSKPCRTGFLCRRYTLGSDQIIRSAAYAAADPLLAGYPYRESRWYAIDELNPVTGAGTVADWLPEACRLAVYD